MEQHLGKGMVAVLVVGGGAAAAVAVQFVETMSDSLDIAECRTTSLGM